MMFPTPRQVNRWLMMVDTTLRRHVGARVTNLTWPKVGHDDTDAHITGMTEELNLSVAVEEYKKKSSDLQFMEKNEHEGTVVEVQDQRIYFIPNASYISVSRIVFFKSEGCLNYAV